MATAYTCLPKVRRVTVDRQSYGLLVAMPAVTPCIIFTVRFATRLVPSSSTGQAPAGAMRRIFKKYDNKLTKEQFAEEVSKLRHKTLSKSVNESKLDGRKVKTDEEEIAETNKRITELIAGKKDHITFEAFQNLRKSL